MANYQSGKNTALLVGCNYAHNGHKAFGPLGGCHNDVNAMRAMLSNVYNFHPNNIKVLMDKSGTQNDAMPTGANIKNVLGHLISQLQKGDVLFFHFSGHGTRTGPEKNVEAIVPCDFNLITKMDFRMLVSRLPQGATFVLFSDSCNSGGLIDKETEQIGPNTSSRNARMQSNNGRFISQEIVLAALLETHSRTRGLNNMPQDITTVMQHVFGSDASILFRQTRNQLPRSLNADQGILLSACQSDEYADEYVNNDGHRLGVFTSIVQVIITQKLLPQSFSYRQLVTKAREMLKSKNYLQQHPCLYCSNENVDRSFLVNKSKPPTPTGKNLALLVGCNYPNTKYDLRGGYNNVSAMHTILTTAFGFENKNIEVLTDKPGTKTMPTGANIRNSLIRLISQLKSGDVLFFYFSGHGTRIPMPPSNFLETIVGCDFDYIKKWDFRDLVDRAPAGATFTFLADCSHSGGLINKDKEQINPKKISSNAHRPTALKGDQGILLSACQSDEVALDYKLGGEQYMGAFTRAVQVIIQDKLLSCPFTNKELVMKAREIFPIKILKGSPNQHPCLHCTEENANHYFLSNLPKS